MNWKEKIFGNECDMDIRTLETYYIGIVIFMVLIMGATLLVWGILPLLYFAFVYVSSIFIIVYVHFYYMHWRKNIE